MHVNEAKWTNNRGTCGVNMKLLLCPFLKLLCLHINNTHAQRDNILYDMIHGHDAQKVIQIQLYSPRVIICTLPPDVPRGVRLEKLLTARLWPRCLRLQAVRHFESMLCLMRYQSDSVMPNLWNKWPVRTQRGKK